MEAPNSILILGSNGFLGSFLTNELIKSEFRVASLNRSELDLARSLDPYSINWLANSPYKYVLICAAVADIETCFQDQVKSHQVNVQSMIQILDIALRTNKIPIFFSSDYVFSYKQYPHKEDDLRLPLTVYGRQKLEVETFIESNFPHYLIFRTSKLMSKTRHPKNILYPVIKALSTSQNVNCFSDQWLNPVFIEDIAEIIKITIKDSITGTFHLGSKIIYTREQIGKLLAIAIKKPVELVFPISMRDVKFSEPRPNYNTLDCKKIEDLISFKFLELEDIISDLKGFFL